MQPYEPEVGDLVVCNPELPEEIFQAAGLPTNQTYTVEKVGPDPEGNNVFVSVTGEDGKRYENLGSIFFVKKTLH